MQREAVLAGGAGDYISMILGDKEAPQGVPPEIPIVAKEKVEKDTKEVKAPVEAVVAAAVVAGAAGGTASPTTAASADSKKPASSGSWAAMVAANASAASAQTIVATTTGLARILRPATTRDSAPPSPDRKTNGRVASANGTSSAKKPSGSTSGSVTGDKGTADKNRDRRRGNGERKEGDRPARAPGGERRDRGTRERDPNGKVRETFHCYPYQEDWLCASFFFLRLGVINL